MGLGGAWHRIPIAAVALVTALALAVGPAWAAEPQGEAGSGPRPSRPASRTLASARTPWGDVTSEHAWARTAIEYVAAMNDWMDDVAPLEDGTPMFGPDRLETRRLFARALVRAFARDAVPDPTITFPDLPQDAPGWRFAAIAVGRGWMTRAPGGGFAPAEPVTMTQVHRGLVLALGLGPAVDALQRISTADGRRVPVPASFGVRVLGMRLGLRYPSSSALHDVHPWTPMPRIQVAYSLWVAAEIALRSPWRIQALADQYAEVVLPRMSDARLELVRWGARFAGYPYVWGGEWGFKRPAPAALGGQTIPGFDCSGFTWWVLRRNEGDAWRVAPPRPYAGWPLAERTSALMAAAARERLRYDELRPGDLMFYDGNRDGVVDHVDVYVGNGWALDSSNTPAGVTLMWVGTGWYRDHFVFGRRITR
jgi:hypothetical protein